jgi:prepilin-type N-terminal cleavage/methylation domain-containing protein
MNKGLTLIQLMMAVAILCIIVALIFKGFS